MDIFLFKLLLSFFVGGAYIALMLLIAEKLSPKLGGLLIGLPSTTLVGILFVGWTEGTPALMQALPILPAAGGACVLFAAAFVFFRKSGILPALALALASWFAVSLPLAYFGLTDIWLSLLISAVLYCATFMYSNRFSGTALKTKSSAQEFVLRAALAGTVIAVAVYLSHYAGPLWGGIFIAFPAAFLSSLYLFSKKHGIEKAGSLLKGMVMGSSGTVVFMVMVYLFVAQYGLVPSILFAYAICAAYAYMVYKLA